eukprot:1445942-Prymnesium_polylepis.1
MEKSKRTWRLVGSLPPGWLLASERSKSHCSARDARLEGKARSTFVLHKQRGLSHPLLRSYVPVRFPRGAPEGFSHWSGEIVRLVLMRGGASSMSCVPVGN